MKLSKGCKYTILCEDKLSQCYVRRFLMAQGIAGRKIFMTQLPAQGCGEQYVRRQFPKYLTALRSKSFDSNVLVVAIDADAKSCVERCGQLDEMCRAAGVSERSEAEKALVFIPKRNIETWVKHFCGENVDENQDYAHFLSGHESDCYSAADKMAEEFSNPSFTSELSSLVYAHKEYLRVVNLVKR